MSVTLNQKGLDHARRLVEAHHYVIDSDWGDAQPDSDAGNAEIERNGYEGYGAWHLAVRTEENEGTKGRYMFPFGDFRRVHRSALAAAKQRAGEWDYKDVLEAADALLSRIPDPAAKS